MKVGNLRLQGAGVEGAMHQWGGSRCGSGPNPGSGPEPELPAVPPTCTQFPDEGLYPCVNGRQNPQSLVSSKYSKQLGGFLSCMGVYSGYLSVIGLGDGEDILNHSNHLWFCILYSFDRWENLH